MTSSLRIIDAPPKAPRLADGAVLGGWYHEDPAEAGRLICDLCPRECALRDGDRGFCFVRENRAGQMVLGTYGHSTGFCIDPIEKKPLNQFYPNTSVLSFGTAGCNLGCKFCQNWSISKSREVERLSESASPEAIARAALELQCQSVAFTYNDPVIWAEYAIDTAKACHAVGVKTVAVTAGYITPQARGAFYEVMDAANVDLKAFTEEFYYKQTLSHLQPVLDTLEWLKRETNVWFEITNLVIPGANDSTDELARMCDWIYDHLGPAVPVHFTAFHPDFRMRDRPNTPPETLFRAYDLATRRGLQYVYVGNIADVPRQTTYCPGCKQALIIRAGYDLHRYALHWNRCGYCGVEIAGRYNERPGTWGPRRQPVRIAEYQQSSQSGAKLQIERGSEYSMRQTPVATPTLVNLSPTKAKSMSSSTAPVLTDAQQQQILGAAAEVLAATAEGRQPQWADQSLAGAAGIPIFGCFVTAKRESHLRSCCGFMTPNIPLLQALVNSARRTANDDHRFPHISPSELPHLHLDVWLLFNPQLVTARGEARRDVVVIGKHGLQVAQGDKRGLLLPGVALEHGLDAERFLQHVCLKAGLPPHAWRNDDVELATFEGVAIEGPMPATAARGVEKPRVIQPAELATLCQWVGANVVAHLTGGTPFPYAFNVSDGEVGGMYVRVGDGQREWLHINKFSLRENSPLQSTLYTIAEQIARVLASMGIDGPTLSRMQVDIALFDDISLHGNASSPDLRGIDTNGRAVLIVERNNLGVAFSPGASADDVFQHAFRSAQLMAPEASQVFGARVTSTLRELTITQHVSGTGGARVREPAMAGSFYPKQPQELQSLVNQLFAGDLHAKRRVPAIMLPHAGLVFSGRVAAEVLKRVEVPPTIIIIGPKHTPLGVDWAVAPHEVWKMPGGEIASDTALAQELVQAIPGLQLDAAAHEREHGIEVELPLLAHVAPGTKVVGIAIGAGNYQRCREFAEGLTKVLRNHPGEIMLVVSSDMNHFATDAENRRLDELALRCIDNLDAERLLATCREQSISMCGVLPTVMVMETLKNLGQLNRSERVAYATSADVTGDKQRVVGYAGVIWE